LQKISKSPLPTPMATSC